MFGETFHEFIEFVLKENTYDYFITLVYVPEKHKELLGWQEEWKDSDPLQLEGWPEIPATPDDCLSVWLNRALKQRYLYFEEYGDDGQIRFHVFTPRFKVVPERLKRKWVAISGGWAVCREADPRRGFVGLIGYFLMRKHFPMVIEGGHCSGSYTSRDFCPWNE